MYIYTCMYIYICVPSTVHDYMTSSGFTTLCDRIANILYDISMLDMIVKC